MSQYFIKRGEMIHGPFSTKQVKSGLESGKLKDADLISESKDGPWQTVTEQFQEPAPEGEVNSEDLPTGEDAFFENVEIPAVATPVAQFPTPTKKNEGEDIEQGEDPNNNEENPNIVVCPDCNKTVSKKASSCPHCGSPLNAWNMDAVAGKTLAIVGSLKDKAQVLKENVSNKESLSELAKKTKDFAGEFASQAQNVKESEVVKGLVRREKEEWSKNRASVLLKLAVVPLFALMLLYFLGYPQKLFWVVPNQPAVIEKAANKFKYPLTFKLTEIRKAKDPDESERQGQNIYYVTVEGITNTKYGQPVEVSVLFYMAEDGYIQKTLSVSEK